MVRWKVNISCHGRYSSRTLIFLHQRNKDSFIFQGYWWYTSVSHILIIKTLYLNVSSKQGCDVSYSILSWESCSDLWVVVLGVGFFCCGLWVFFFFFPLEGNFFSLEGYFQGKILLQWCFCWGFVFSFKLPNTVYYCLDFYYLFYCYLFL